MLDPWVADYVGLPFGERGRTREDGLDCWGLVRLVLLERAGVLVPSGADRYSSLADRASIKSTVEGGVVDWLEVCRPPDFSAARTFDVVLMRARPYHVGLVVGRGWMLHIEDGIDSCAERFDRGVWKQRVLGVYRWQTGSA